MARRLRLQFEGALYHLINRGNYRRDAFATMGAANAFLTALGETCERYGFRVHAYVVMQRPKLPKGVTSQLSTNQILEGRDFSSAICRELRPVPFSL